MKARGFRRICENPGHKEIELKSFEKCPICSSESYHKTIIKVLKEAKK